MRESINTNKRIAKNTMYLYVRMLLVMAIAIYTSRIVLRTLGAEDYGICNVVGGIVAIMGVLNAVMSSSTSRFLTFELGRNDSELLNKTFSVSLNLHIIVAILVLIIAETLGLWFFYEKLVIPESRMEAAFWVYQFSIINTMFTFTQVPYNATLIAHENLSVYAYVGLYDAFSKLLIVYLITISPIDKLILYAFLLMFNQILIQMFYRYYTYKKYLECRFRLVKDRELYKRQLSYSGWELFGGLAFVSQGQGINIMLNLFFGPTVNAARAIAYQIQSSVNQFINNFLMAVQPQVIKNYAQGNPEEMYRLTFQSAKFSFFLMLALILPLCYELRFILDLWLGDAYPEETYLFSMIVLILGLTEIFRLALIMPFHAIGKMKLGNSLNGTIMIMALPISYIVLKLGYPSYSVFIVLIIINIIVTFNGWLIVHSYSPFSIRMFFVDVVFPCLFVCVLSMVIPTILLLSGMKDGWIRFIALCVSTELALIIIVFCVGLKSEERVELLSFVRSKLLGKNEKFFKE